MQLRKKLWLRNGALGILVVGTLIAIGCYTNLSKADWASWVQAVGSIAAISIGFILADRQSRSAALQLRRERLVVDDEQARCALAVAMFVRAKLEPALQEMRSPGSVRGYLEISADYMDFDGVKRAIDSVPLFQLRSAEAMEGVLLLNACLSKVQHMTRIGQQDPVFANRDYDEFMAAAEEALNALDTAFQYIVDLAEQCHVVLVEHDDRHGHIR